MATLKRISDGIGSSGQRVEAIEWNKDGSIKAIKGHRPVVGFTLLVGPAKSYHDQDCWLTTAVTEILEEKYNNKNLIYVKFRTGKLTYELTY